MSQKKTKKVGRSAAKDVDHPLTKTGRAASSKPSKKATSTTARTSKTLDRPKAKSKVVAKTTRKPAIKVPTSKTAVRTAVKRSRVVKENVPKVPVTAPVTTAKPTIRFSDEDLQDFRKLLGKVRNDLVQKVTYLRDSSLRRDDEVNHAEDGTDAFDRLFSLERAGGVQERIYAIDEALREIADGSYGICQSCQSLIRKQRLLALPFARNCIQCQAEQERKRDGQNLPSAPRRFVP